MINVKNSFAKLTIDRLNDELKQEHARIDDFHERRMEAYYKGDEVFDTYYRLSVKACKVRVNEIYEVLRLMESTFTEQ